MTDWSWRAAGDPGCEDWPVTWPCDVATTDPALLDAAHALATDLLWNLSGGRLGVCAYTERYRPPGGSSCVTPYMLNGQWYNGRGGACCQLLLAHAPVVEVLSVAVWDEALAPDEYAVTNNSWLRRRGVCWPSVPDCDDPPVSVSYRAGIPIPAGTGAAVGEVACEYLAGMSGGTCKLPSWMTSITRQGVTVAFDSAADTVARGRTGLPVADAWLDSVNRQSLATASRVLSPDLARRV